MASYASNRHRIRIIAIKRNNCLKAPGERNIAQVSLESHQGLGETWKRNPMRTKHNLHENSSWLHGQKTPARLLISVLGVILSLMTGVVPAASLNKCVDAYGKVTYSNLPCKGANEVRKVEIDPAPPVPPAVPVTPLALPAMAVPESPKVEVPVYLAPQKNPVVSIPKSGAAPLEKKAAIKFETLGGPKKQSQNTCDTLSDKLGLVLDKMDAARRKGYTQKQMDDWNSEIKSLESKKQQSGCF